MSQSNNDQFMNVVDLASSRVGARVLAANDEFFAAKENLIKPEPAIFIEDKYTERGKWMDGWESRRRRTPGDDWCLIRLGLRGIAKTIVVDTAFFRGNYPEACSIEATSVAGRPDVDTLLSDSTEWFELLPKSELQGDSKNTFQVKATEPITHIRLRIFPDGGVARLRVYGRVMPDWDWLDFSQELTDLIGIANGGKVLGASDMFFSPALNLIMQGAARHMGEGWETKRRRGPGHDWASFAFGEKGSVLRVEVDTSHFKGNAPGECEIEVANHARGSDADPSELDWQPLLSRTPLQPDTRHFFQDELKPIGLVTHARINIYPDGGIARLRLFGRSERAMRLLFGLGRINTAADEQAMAGFLRCCGSQAWAKKMMSLRPFGDVASLLQFASRVWWSLDREDWLEAFAAHPKIGAKKIDDKGAGGWAEGEQAGAKEADAAVLSELAAKNQAYQEKFGYIYIVCATGKSAQEMLDILNRRLGHDAGQEIEAAAAEQAKITQLRLIKWLGESIE